MRHFVSRQNNPSAEASCTCINAKSRVVHKAFLSDISEMFILPVDQAAPMLYEEHICFHVSYCPALLQTCFNTES